MSSRHIAASIAKGRRLAFGYLGSSFLVSNFTASRRNSAVVVGY
jgi:hypothetical protein